MLRVCACVCLLTSVQEAEPRCVRVRVRVPLSSLLWGRQSHTACVCARVCVSSHFCQSEWSDGGL